VNENHPVLLSMQTELTSLRDVYRRQPDEQSRYQVVRLERLIDQWAPGRLRAS
jgi:hypothetical protein